MAPLYIFSIFTPFIRTECYGLCLSRARIPHYKPVCVSNYSLNGHTSLHPLISASHQSAPFAILLFQISSPRSFFFFFLFLLSVLTSSYTHFFIHSIKSFLLCLSLLPPFCTAYYIPPSVNLIMPFHFYLITPSSCTYYQFLHSCMALHSFSLLLITSCPFYPPPFNASIYKTHYIPPNAFIFTPNHLCISLHYCPGTFLCAFLFVHLIMAPSDTHMSLPASPFRCSHCIASFYVCISLHPILLGLTTS